MAGPVEARLRDMATPYLALKDVWIAYDKVIALRGVAMQMEQGEIIALIGANGAGKTTLLRAISGLVTPTRGEIWFDGHRLDTWRPEQIVARGISMVPEGRHVYPYMNVKDNLLMGAYLRRDPAAVRDDLDRVLGRFPRLRERFRQVAGSLSGGEQQMLAIGRALMARPRLLLLDEPSLGLAPMMVRDIAKAITTINRDDRVSVVLVEQNSRLALKIAARGYVLESGRIALAGPARDLLDNDHVRRVYLGV
jgi:branched-chain amino acid transport system ATP-binding protein